jgi:hypothetical protein
MNPLNPLAPYAALFKLGAIALLLGFVFFGGRSCGKQAGDDEVSALKVSHAQTMRGIAEQTAKVAELARKTEQAWGDAFIAVALQHQRDLANAQVTEKDVADAVRAGTLQLREHWRCPAVPRASAAPAAAGRADDAAELRAADSGALVRVGKEADAAKRLCQATLKAERQ